VLQKTRANNRAYPIILSHYYTFSQITGVAENQSQ